MIHNPVPPMSVLCDASFDFKTKIAHIGYSDPFMFHTKHKRIKCKDNNQAELEAVVMASKNLPVDVLIFTDSQYAIDHFDGEHTISKVCRDNVANTFVRINKENHNRRGKTHDK